MKVIVLCLIVGFVAAEEVPSNPYQFSYSTGQQGPAQIFREEQRSPDGTVVGKYGYVDPNGQLRVIEYRAGPNGFQASGDTGPDQETMRIANQLQQQDQQDKQRHLSDLMKKAAPWSGSPTAPIQPTWNSQQSWNTGNEGSTQQAWNWPAPNWNTRASKEINWNSWNGQSNSQLAPPPPPAPASAPAPAPRLNWNSAPANNWENNWNNNLAQSAWPQMQLPSGGNPLANGPYTFFMINHNGRNNGYSYTY